MKKTKYELNDIKSISIHVSCDLKLLGWEKQEIFTEADEDVLSVNAEDQKANIDCLCDCIISLPNSVRIDRLFVGGDASVLDFSGPISGIETGGDLEIARAGEVSCSRVGGDLQIHDISGKCDISEVGGDLAGQGFQQSLRIGKVHGDCSITEVEKDIQVDAVGGDCSLSSLRGTSSVGKVGGDCYLENGTGSAQNLKAGGDVVCTNLIGECQISAGGDASIEIAEGESQAITLKSGGDLAVHFKGEAGGKYQIRSAGEEIKIQLPNHSETVSAREYEFSIGESQSTYQFSAGGEVTLTDKPMEKSIPQSVFGHFESSFEKVMEKMRQRIDLDERIAEKADLFAQKAEKHAEKIARKVEKKVAAAMERLEGHGHPHSDFEVPFTPVSSWDSAEEIGKNQITDDEKNLILKMLQEKKITPEEAEKLFEALENKKK